MEADIEAVGYRGGHRYTVGYRGVLRSWSYVIVEAEIEAVRYRES